MGLTLFEAAKSFQNPLSAGLFKAIATDDELFSVLPFSPKEGNAFSYTREKALPTAEWVSPTHTSLVDSTSTEDQVTVPIREIASNFSLREFALAQQDGTRQLAVQMMQKGKAVGREIADKLINGGHVTGYTLPGAAADPFNAVDAVVAGPWIDSQRFGPGELRYTHAGTLWEFRAPGDRTFGEPVEVAADGTVRLHSDSPSKYIDITLDVSDATANGRCAIEFTSTTNEPDGLAKMCDLVRVPKGANGDDFAYEILDELIDQVKVKENLAFIMPSALRRKYKAKGRALGGTTPDYVVQSFDPSTGQPVQRSLMSYDGIPILKNDFIRSNEVVGGSSNCSSIYLVSLSDGEGQGLYAGAFGGASNEASVDPIRRTVLGFQFIPGGTMEQRNSRLWRAVWYGGFALGSGLAAARARGIKTV